MQRRVLPSRRILLTLPLVILSWSIGMADAANTYFWDPTQSGGSTTGGSNAAFTWDTLTSNWWNGSVDTTWANNNIAVFGGSSGGTATLNANFAASSLIFNFPGYTIDGLSNGEAISVNSIAVNGPNTTAADVINSGLTASGLSFMATAGSGNLTIGGASALSNGVTYFSTAGTNTMSMVTLNSNNGSANAGNLAIYGYSLSNNASGGWLQIGPNANYTFTNLQINNGLNGHWGAVMQQTGGTLNFTGNAELYYTYGASDAFDILSGGFQGIAGSYQAGFSVGANNNPVNGQLVMSGGTMSVGTTFYAGGTTVNSAKLSYCPVFVSGGSLAVGGAMSFVGGNTSGYTNLYVGGGTVTVSGGSVGLGGAFGNGNAYLAGSSVLAVNKIVRGADTSGDTLYFNGGTLRALSTNNTDFMGVQATPASGNNALGSTAGNYAYIYAGGATFDTNGNNVTVYPNLLAATGLSNSGVYSVTIPPQYAGSKYASPPVVTFSGGGGSGAQGYATLGTNGGIAAIIVTNPGTGYTSAPSVSLSTVASIAEMQANIAPNWYGFRGPGGVAATPSSWSVTMVSASAGGLTKIDPGTLTLAGSNTYTGSTNIDGGTLQANSSTALGSGGNIVFDGGALQYTSLSASQDWGARIKSSTASICLDTNGQNVTLNGAIDSSNTGGLTKLGAGTLALGGANGFSGPITIANGLLSLNNASALPSAPSIMFGAAGTSGTLDLGGQALTNVQSLAVSAGASASGQVIGNSSTVLASTLTFNPSPSAASTFGGTIQDTVANGPQSVALHVSAGTLTLAGMNSYSGATTVNGGSLVVNGALNSAGAVSVAPSGAVAAVLSGSGSLGSVTIGNGGQLSPGYNGSAGTLTTNGLTLNAGSSLNFSLGAPGSGTLVEVGTGMLTLPSAPASITVNLSNVGGMSTGYYTLIDASAGSLAGTFNPNAFAIGTTPAGFQPGEVFYSFSDVGNQIDMNVASGPTWTGAAGNGLWSAANWTPAITGSGQLLVFAGTLETSTTNDYANPYVAGGLIFAPGAGAFNLAGSGVILEGQIANFGSNLQTIALPLTLSGSGGGVNAASGPITISLSISESGGSCGITKTGASGLTLASTNAYSGLTDIQAGTLHLGVNNAIPAAIQVSGGTLNLNGFSQTTPTTVTMLSGAIVGSGTGVLTAGGYAIDSGTVSAVLASAGSLSKTTGGSAILAAANTYSGVTQISGGVLAVDVLAAGGAASGIGKSSNAAANLTIGGGTLQYLGGGASTDRLFTIGSGGAGIDASGSGPLRLTNSGAEAFSAASGGVTLTLGGSNAGANQLAAAIADAPGGTTALSKAGPGVWVLTASNSFSGGTSLNGGTLSLANSAALGSSGVISFNGGTLQFTASNTDDYSNYGGVNRISNAANQAYSFNTNGQNATLAGNLVSFGGSLQKTGAGLLLLSGNNSYSGGTNVGGGTLQLGNASAIGASTGALTVNGVLDLAGYSPTIGSLAGAGTILNSSAGSIATLALNASSGTSSFGGNLTNGAGTLALNVSGGGTLVLSGTSGYSGGTTLGGGALQFASSAALPSAGPLSVSGTMDLGGFTMTNPAAVSLLNGSLQNGTIINNGSGYSAQGGTISASLQGSAGLTKATAAALTLAGNNSYAGGTNVSAGLLQIASNNALSTAGSISVNGGTLDLGGYTTTMAAAVAVQGVLQNGTLINGGSYSAQGGTISASLQGSAGLSKTTSATLLLTGNNTYTGGTSISGGLLQIAVPGALSTAGPLTVNAGTLDLGGYSASVPSLSGSAGTIFSSAAAAAVTLTAAQSSTTTFGGALSDGGGTLALVFNGSGQLNLSGTSSYSGPTAIYGGALAAASLADGGQYSSIGASGSNAGNLLIDGGALRYLGGATSTNRLFTIGSTTYSATLDASGTGPLVFSNSGAVLYANNGQSNAIILTGSSTAANTFTPTIHDPEFNGSTSLTKNGGGTWVLAGRSDYTGPTTVAAGKLVIATGALLDETPITVNGGATLAVAAGGGTIATGTDGGLPAGATLTLLSGSTFDMTDGAAGAFTLREPANPGVVLTLAGAALKFDLAASGADLLSATAGLASVSGMNTISVAGVGGSLAAGSYPLISVPGGALNGSDFALSSSTIIVGGATYDLALANSGGTAELLTVSLPTAGSGRWNTASGNWSNANNWIGGAPDAAGGGAIITLATSGQQTVTLDEPVTVGTLELGNSADSAAGYTISGSGGNTLTMNNFGSAATITVDSGTHEIDTAVVLAGNLAIDGSGTLTFGTGGISDGGNGRSLTLNGPGMLILAGSDSYGGGTTVSGGTLVAGSAEGLADGSSLTVGDASAFAPVISEGAGTASIAPVPEPGTLALLIFGLTGAAAQRCRTRRP